MSNKNYFNSPAAIRTTTKSDLSNQQLAKANPILLDSVSISAHTKIMPSGLEDCQFFMGIRDQ